MKFEFGDVVSPVAHKNLSATVSDYSKGKYKVVFPDGVRKEYKENEITHTAGCTSGCVLKRGNEFYVMMDSGKVYGKAGGGSGFENEYQVYDYGNRMGWKIRKEVKTVPFKSSPNTVVNAKVTIIKKADGWWVRCPDGSLRGKSDTVHGATVWAERNGYKDWTVEHRMGNAIRSKDSVVNGALRHVAENAWFCKDEEVLYKGKPAVVRSILPGGVYMVDVGGQRLRARGNELSAPWTNSKGCNKTCNAKFKVGDFVFDKNTYRSGKVEKDADKTLIGVKDDFTGKVVFIKRDNLEVRNNEYPRAAANGEGPNGWDAKQCAAALKGATDEQVKIAASDPRNPLLQKCARVEARSRGIVINADASGDDGKCTTCEFGCYKRPNMSCKRGYDPKIANGKCKYWCADSMTKAVRNMSTQQAISSVEMLLGSDDPMDHDEALAILQHHRSDIEREVGGWQYRDLYRRANNAKAKKA